MARDGVWLAANILKVCSSRSNKGFYLFLLAELSDHWFLMYASFVRRHCICRTVQCFTSFSGRLSFFHGPHWTAMHCSEEFLYFTPSLNLPLIDSGVLAFCTMRRIHWVSSCFTSFSVPLGFHWSAMQPSPSTRDAALGSNRSFPWGGSDCLVLAPALTDPSIR